MTKDDKVGVLILAFNRPESFSRLIECLLTNTSQEIYISVDGGCTKNNEQVRNLANAFKNKYPTKIHINLMSENYGVRRGVIKGIDWFFENVEIGIILEEDLEILVTNPQNLFSSMFKFLHFNCDTVINLSTFKTIKNPQAFENNSLVFYKNQDFYMWGWATHKTVWEGFKRNLSSNNFKQFRLHLANKSLETMQYRTNHFLKELGNDILVRLDGYKVKANGTIKEEISAVIIRDGERTFSSLSGGEQVRVLFSSILANRYLINSTHPHGGLDFLSVDEVFDKIDSVGMKHLIRSAKKLETCIMVISHVSDEDLSGEDILTIVKENGVSTIKQ